MRVVRRFIYREVVASVAFTTLAFLALFFFFDLIDELRWVGRGSYRISHALLFVALSLPTHLYELLPITVLIGTIFVMARLAQSSEFTILRTSGLGPWRALATLLLLGAVFSALTFACGDYLAPASERMAQLVRARSVGAGLSSGATGAWLREREGELSRAINVHAIEGDSSLSGIRVFEFDAHGRLVQTLQAARAVVADSGAAWQLAQVERNVFEHQGEQLRVRRLNEASFTWPTRISSDMVAASLLNPERMGTLELFRYIDHLQANGQAAQRYQIAFWRKVFYPLGCLVMVVLSLPFAYLHFRSRGIAASVFGGVMAGISFFLLNNVFGFAGHLQNWTPWLTAAAPGLIYSALSLSAFTWLVLRR